MDGRSPAQVYALLFGVVLVGAGIIGFFYDGSFETGDGASREAVLGILDVNGWHNIVHIVPALAGLAVAASYGSARLYAIGLGAVYILVAIAGFIAGNGNEIVGFLVV